MAESPSSRGTGLVGVILGALIVIAVAMYFLGGFGPRTPTGGTTNVTVNPPASAPASPPPATSTQPPVAPAPGAPARP